MKRITIVALALVALIVLPGVVLKRGPAGGSGGALSEFRVEDYGAVPDDGVSDGDAVNAAIAAANGNGIVTMGCGNFTVGDEASADIWRSDMIFLSISGTHLRGSGYCTSISPGTGTWNNGGGYLIAMCSDAADCTTPDAEFGTADAGAGNNELDDSSKTWTLDEFVGRTVKLTAGTGKGQSRIVTANTTDGTLTVASDWDNNPDATTSYEILFRISNLTLENLRVHDPDPAAHAKTGGEESHGIYVSNVQDSVIKNIWIDSLGDEGIDMTGRARKIHMSHIISINTPSIAGAGAAIEVEGSGHVLTDFILDQGTTDLADDTSGTKLLNVAGLASDRNPEAITISNGYIVANPPSVYGTTGLQVLANSAYAVDVNVSNLSIDVDRTTNDYAIVVDGSAGWGIDGFSMSNVNARGRMDIGGSANGSLAFAGVNLRGTVGAGLAIGGGSVSWIGGSISDFPDVALSILGTDGDVGVVALSGMSIIDTQGYDMGWMEAGTGGDTDTFVCPTCDFFRDEQAGDLEEGVTEIYNATDGGSCTLDSIDNLTTLTCDAALSVGSFDAGDDVTFHAHTGASSSTVLTCSTCRFTELGLASGNYVENEPSGETCTIASVDSDEQITCSALATQNFDAGEVFYIWSKDHIISGGSDNCDNGVAGAERVILTDMTIQPSKIVNVASTIGDSRGVDEGINGWNCPGYVWSISDTLLDLEDANGNPISDDQASSDAAITGFTVVKNVTIKHSGAHGIDARNGIGFQIEGNKILDVKEDGIRLDNTTASKIINNTISGAGSEAIHEVGTADNNICTGNISTGTGEAGSGTDIQCGSATANGCTDAGLANSSVCDNNIDIP